MTAVLGIVYRAISTHLIRKAGRTQATAQSGAVTLIQRFGSALNLNIHFHLLVLDGVYGRVNSHLTLDREGTALDSLLSHSITYRIALGPRAGQKAFTLQGGASAVPGGRVGPMPVAGGVSGWQTQGPRVAVFEFPILVMALNSEGGTYVFATHEP